MIVINYRNNHPANQDKDQFTYRNINWDNLLTDVHAVYAPSGCDNTWHEVVGNRPVGPNREQQEGWNPGANPDQYPTSVRYCCVRERGVYR
jgi:hypothetical protein